MSESPYALFCPQCGQVFRLVSDELTEEEYIKQLPDPHELWTCPHCHSDTVFDDRNYEDYEGHLNA